MDGGKDRIPGDDRQHIVEGDVGLLEAVEIGQGLAVDFEGGVQFIDVFFRRMKGGVAGEAHFEEQARILEIADTVSG